MIFENGTVLPSALFSEDHLSEMNAFNKSYSNLPLRIGIVQKTIAADSPLSISQKYPEYNVLVYEQNTNVGGAPTIYKNCPAAQGFGSVADFFEYTLRSQADIKSGANGIDSYNQDGALVLLLCINGYGDRGVIISAINHPNRETTIDGDEKHLEGEFNGVNIKVNDDGSCSLMFSGATDNWGNPLDPNQGVTTVSIESDGSIQVQNAGGTQRIEKSGNISFVNTGNLSSSSDGNMSFSANKGAVSLTSNSNDLIASTKGDLTFNLQKAININADSCNLKINNTASLKAQQILLEAQSLASIKSPTIVLDGITFLGGNAGLPVPTLVSMYLGNSVVGPVLSVCVSGFSTKVFVT